MTDRTSSWVPWCVSLLRTRTLVSLFATLVAFTTLAGAQSWTTVLPGPGVPVGGAPLLLTDGTVIVQQMNAGLGTGNWWKLTPDANGNYTSGTWSQIASMPSGYAPTFYASAVLPDGRAIAEGGEYNGSSGNQAETNLGAIYNPATNTWTSVNHPSGVANIGDAQSVVLSNGTFMLGSCCTTSQFLLNASNLTWTVANNSGKADSLSEEGWTLLPSGKVLTVDTRDGTNSELYNSSTQSWSSAGSTIVALSDGSPNFEIGPAVLRPDGTVFALGATGNTAIYNTNTGGWSQGPTFSSGLDVADGPAALLPSGNVLVVASPGVFKCCLQFFEFNGSNLISAPLAQNSNERTSFQENFLVLPTGQVLLVDQSDVVQIYTPAGTFQSSWRPTVTSVASSLTAGSTNNSISGTQFNGLSQGGMYGDDAQSATNYPLVRITNNSSGHVFYAKTHNHSTMGVATGSATVSTQFDVPSVIDGGASTLTVVANGIPSSGTAVTITGTSQSNGFVTINGTANLGTCTDDQGDPTATMTITVGSVGASQVWGCSVQTPTINQIAANLASQLNGSVLTAWSSGNTVYFRSVAKGSGTNYPISADDGYGGYWYVLTPSGPTMTGGQ